MRDIQNYSNILGINRRNLSYIERCNGKRSVLLANDKISTKVVLNETGILVPKTFAILRDRKSLSSLDLETLKAFVLKPNSGRGGIGILIATMRENGGWIGPGDRWYNGQKITYHTLNILDGYYSRRNMPDVAIFEELVRSDPRLQQLCGEGLPDIRIIVYKGVPILSMMRLPTKASGGKANLHQGAVGVGIDIDSGKTTWGVLNRKPLQWHPETEIRLRDIMIPEWDKIVRMSIECYEATGLGYMGVDVVLDALRRPMVLELNAHPGLDIQIANHIGLLGRLSRTEGYLGRVEVRK